MKCDFFENFLSLAMTIHAAGDKWAGRGGPALQWQKTIESTTESTKGTKMKTSENLVISVPFVVKNLSFHP
jgi:hypothetical protein